MHGLTAGWMRDAAQRAAGLFSALLASLLAALFTEVLAAPALASDAAGASTLSNSLQARFAGDRTGVCLVAAVVQGPQVQRARYCAQPEGPPRPDVGPGLDDAFEIGSISKTLVAALVAGLVEQGRWALQDPLLALLPPGTPAPQPAQPPILLEHVLTHRAGLPPLPPGWQPADPANPYADLDEAQLWAALGRTQLPAPPGSRAQYSNFGFLLLSAAVARATGGDLEAALRARLFQPLGMHGANVRPTSTGPVAAQGHLPTGEPTPAWTTRPNLAGVGMVRARLDDLVAFAQAHLRAAAGAPALPGTEALQAALLRSQQPLAPGFAMAWMRPEVQGHTLLMHEGGTGGFSSLLALWPERQRAVVLLADTALADLGGLADIGLPLLGLNLPLGTPRRTQAPPDALLAALPGSYDLAGLRVRLWVDQRRIRMQAEGQGALDLQHDSRGDLYPLGLSALLTPLPMQGGRLPGFIWRQGGGVVRAVRVDTPAAPGAPALSPLSGAASLPPANPAAAAPSAASALPTPAATAGRDWAGDYPLAAGFALRVFEAEGRWWVQATGQNRVPLEVTGPDRAEMRALDLVLEFERDATGAVHAVTLRQRGQVLQGPKRVAVP